MDLKSELSVLEKWVEQIGQTLDTPILKENTFVYQKLTIPHVAFLKAVRAVQSLHSLRVLYAEGLAVDGGTIIRSLLDCHNEIYFLLENYPEYSADVRKFKDHFESTSLVGNQEKVRTVLSRKIHRARARLLQQRIEFAECFKDMRRIYEAFSAYVHSSYSAIMEIYGGKPGEYRFHMSGIPSVEKKAEYVAAVEEMTMGTELVLAFMAQKLVLKDLFEEIKKHLLASG